MSTPSKKTYPFKLALVTGASSGLGLALCQRLAKEQIPLLLVGKNPERLHAAATLLPNVIETLCLDLAQDRGKLLNLIRQYAPDLVINNAGFGLYGPALMHKTSSQMDILEVNATAPIEISLEAVKVLYAQKKQGVILNVSSIAGELSMPSMAVYAAAKGCLTSFSKSFDAEMRPFEIRILVALPGQINTEFATRASNSGYVQRSKWALKKEDAAEQIWKQIVLRKGVQVIGFRNRLALGIIRFFPRRLVDWAIQKNLSNRFY
ncbi:MAG: SDR family NAD(P)-dependent oxidoreductase [Chlamydiota bacterium]